ncbi:unnamed protein product [Cyclocybe aegerita]|uniref:Uncharacterized protein n=1 Tax=Cyclocybe aegerita TaxID=1973307 RepID=A0A8S0XS97_CYCAE|nr:unnamed protein product [Cyclocybe aegerita]
MSAMAAQYVPPPSAFASSSGGGAQHSNTSSPNMRMNESPLDTLVRRTSSRRVRQPGEGNEVRRPRDVHRGNQRQQQAESSSAVNAYDGDQRYTQQHQRPYQAQYQQYNDEDEDDFSEAYATSSYYEPDDDSRPNSHVQAPAQDQRQGVDAEGPRRQMANLRLEIKPNAMAETLHSPLLHSHFARDSVATASDMNSYYGDMDSARTGRASSHSPSRSARSPTGSAMEFDAGRYFADDASSVYSNTTALGGPALRDSWRSTDTGGTVRRPDGDYRDSGAGLPSVVVSSAEQDGAYAIGGGVGQQVKAGRTPIVKPVTANFSRPVREAARPEQEAVGERVQVQVPADMREQKKAVLERNARRGNLEASPQPYMRSPLAREVSAEMRGLQWTCSGADHHSQVQVNCTPCMGQLCVRYHLRRACTRRTRTTSMTAPCHHQLGASSTVSNPISCSGHRRRLLDHRAAKGRTGLKRHRIICNSESNTTKRIDCKSLCDVSSVRRRRTAGAGWVC